MAQSIVDPSGDLQAFAAGTRTKTTRHSLAYRNTRLIAGAFNWAQMAMAEAYINGLGIPDVLFRGLVHASIDAHDV